MWKLPLLSSEKEEEYKALLLERIKSTRGYIPIPVQLEWVLTAKPEELCSRKEELEIKYFSEREYLDCKRGRKRKKKRDITKKEKKAIDKYNKLTKIFNYQKFINGNKEFSFRIAKIIGVNTCVYCNRMYTLNITKGKEGISRPEFDHFFPKSRYPFFALSLYNLIPSCHICNSNCKMDRELPANMNPYANNNFKEDLFRFSYIPDGQGYPKRIVIKDHCAQNKKTIMDILDILKTEEVYNVHVDLEVKDIYEFATKYSTANLVNLLKQVGISSKISQEEAYRMLFGTELLSEKDNDRPLSKLKRDILRELKIIK